MNKPPYLTDYIFVERNLFSPDFCQNFMQSHINEEWHKHTWSYVDPEGNHITQSRKQETEELLVLDVKPEFSNELFNAWSYCSNIYHQKNNINKALFREFSPPRINRYVEGTNMAEHHDNIVSLFRDSSGSPILSFLAFFNDDYEGGDFVFFGDVKIKVNAGDIMIFPSAFMYTHEVETITKGERWSCVSWGF